MSGRDLKDLRKQLRNVVQEIIGDIVTSEIVVAAQKVLTDTQTAFQEAQQKYLTERLDHVEKVCNDSLKKQDTRARAVQGFLVQSSMQELNNFIQNTHVTMLAWQEIVGEKLGATEELNKEIDSRKAVITARLQKEAEERMAKNISSESKPQSPETPQAETPPVQEADKATA